MQINPFNPSKLANTIHTGIETIIRIPHGHGPDLNRPCQQLALLAERLGGQAQRGRQAVAGVAGSLMQRGGILTRESKAPLAGGSGRDTFIARARLPSPSNPHGAPDCSLSATSYPSSSNAVDQVTFTAEEDSNIVDVTGRIAEGQGRTNEHPVTMEAKVDTDAGAGAITAYTEYEHDTHLYSKTIATPDANGNLKLGPPEEYYPPIPVPEATDNLPIREQHRLLDKLIINRREEEKAAQQVNTPAAEPVPETVGAPAVPAASTGDTPSELAGFSTEGIGRLQRMRTERQERIKEEQISAQRHTEYLQHLIKTGRIQPD